MTIAIETLTADDAPRVMRLVEAAGWNQTPRDWLRMIGHQPQGCFKAVEADQLVGTVTTTAYGLALGWIGMMLVDPQYRRAGFGTALMQRALDYLSQQSVRSIYLDATPLGQPLYKKLGFEPEFVFQRWHRQGLPAVESVQWNAGNQRIASPTLDANHLVLDRQAFGVDRQAWLERLAADSRVVTCTHGFGMVRSGRIASYLGPIVADSPSTATGLISALLENVSSQVFWDIPGENHAVEPLARSLGFVPVRNLTRMWRCSPLTTARRELQFALSDPATG